MIDLWLNKLLKYLKVTSNYNLLIVSIFLYRAYAVDTARYASYKSNVCIPTPVRLTAVPCHVTHRSRSVRDGLRSRRHRPCLLRVHVCVFQSRRAFAFKYRVDWAVGDHLGVSRASFVSATWFEAVEIACLLLRWYYPRWRFHWICFFNFNDMVIEDNI